MKTIDEITDYVENTKLDGSEECSLRLANALVWLCEVVKSQGSDISRASNIASCLANGIHPD